MPQPEQGAASSFQPPADAGPEVATLLREAERAGLRLYLRGRQLLLLLAAAWFAYGLVVRWPQNVIAFSMLAGLLRLASCTDGCSPARVGGPGRAGPSSPSTSSISACWNKTTGTRLLLCAATAAALPPAGLHRLGDFPIRGRRQPVGVATLAAPAGAAAHPSAA